MADQIMKVVDGLKTGILDVTAHANALIGTAAGTDDFLMPNDGKTVLVVVCTAGASSAITFTAVANKWGRTETLVVTPTVSKTSVIGPFPPRLWNNSDGQVEFDPAGGGTATDYYLALRVE